jgi:hypothetical protein
MSFGMLLVKIGGPACILGFLFFMPFAWFFTTRYFDDKLKFERIKDPLEEAFFFAKYTFRPLVYAGLIVLHRAPKKSMLRRFYGDLDFYNAARPIDKIISFPFIIITFSGFGIGIIGTIVYFVAKLFN